MAFKAINNIVDFDSLVLTLFIFGAFLYIIKSDFLSLTVAQYTAALYKAIKKVKKLQADYQVSDALNMHNSFKIDAIYNLPFNFSILI